MKLRPRVLLPLIFVLAVGGGIGGFFVRGTWADGIVRTPTTHADGMIRQLLLTTEGRKIVRGALVVDAPIDAVWDAITDYDHFADFMPNVASLHSSVEADGRFKLSGIVTTFAADFPVELHVKHDRAAWTTSWDEATGEFAVNKGHWTLEKHGTGDHTLVVYELDIEVKGYPSPVVRALVLHRLKKTLRAVEKRVSPKRPS
ncbi:MAG: SRPBCC family protein [Planctomycetota bacterium]